MTDSIHKHWRVVEDFVYETFAIFRIRRSKRLNPRTNKPFSFFLMDGLDWANIIALTPDQSVLLVEQYRHGSESLTLEIPGGCVERGEDPEASARRELEEETGYRVGLIEKLGVIHPNPAMQAMRCHCFIGHGAIRTGIPRLDEGEDIRTLEVPLPEVMRQIGSGAITHSIVLATFALALSKGTLPPLSSLKSRA